MKEVLIELNNVGVFYNIKGSFAKVQKQKKFWALQDISLKVYKGEVLGIIGKNGAGKSTLLSLLSGIIQADRGTVQINTKKVSLLSLQAGFVGYLSGRKNIYLSGMFLGLTKEYLDSKINEIIEFSELGDFIEQPVDTYSSGMKARLGFSTAINLSPDVILIDEVLGVGDESFKIKSSKYIKEKISHSNTTAVLVSHNQKLIEELCDRAIVIQKGTLVTEGGVKEAFESYQKN